MRIRRILLSAVIMAIVGGGLGLLIAEIKYRFYANPTAHQSLVVPAIAGTVIGFLVGATQESVRELKAQQEQEEKMRNYLQTYLRLRDIDNKVDE